MIDYTTNSLGDVFTESGVRVHLTQQAYAENCGEGIAYFANGVDDDGNEYRVSWQTYDNAMEIENEDEMCDWSVYEIEEI